MNEEIVDVAAMSRFAGLLVLALCAAAIALPTVAAAQTDYYNTDAGRPVRVEDAYPVEYRGLELQLAPLRLERSTGPQYKWEVEPEIAWGILPRTQLEIGFPIAYGDASGTMRGGGLAGIDISALHNLNVETAIPALGIAGSVLLPVGGAAPDKAYASVKGIVTRTFTWARFHVNGEYTFGSEPDFAAMRFPGLVELSRWWTGVAVDRTFPLRSLLVTAELVAEQPIHEDDDVRWETAAGIRYQLDPRWALDAGIGRTLSGEHRSWHVTFGSAYAFGLPWRPR
jgi:hypothetical protein